MEDKTELWATHQFPGGEDPILIRRVRDPFGWMGNMAPLRVRYPSDRPWYHTEGLFQALRFSDPVVWELIREEKNPMRAKELSQSMADKRTVPALSLQDLNNMRLCLRFKISQNPQLEEWLLQTGSRRIIEDCTKRQRGSGLFWGAAERSPGVWYGQNWLGRLWEEQRERIVREEQLFNKLVEG